MAVLACASKDQAGDERYVSSGTVSRYYLNIDKTLDDTTDELWIYMKGTLSTTSGFAATYSHLLGFGGLDTAWVTGTANPRAWAEYNSGKGVRITIVDANSVSSSSAVLYTEDTSTHRWTLKVTWISTTQMKAEIFQDGTSKGSHTTPASTLGTIRFRHATGFLAPLSGKGITNQYSWNDALVADEVATVTGDLIGSAIDADVAAGNLLFAMILPNADTGGETEWTASGGGTGIYTEWDDAAGAISSLDYNEILTAVTAQKTQSSEFAVSPNANPIYCVTAFLAEVLHTGWETTKYVLVGDDGTENEQDGYGGATGLNAIGFGSPNGTWNRQPADSTLFWTNSVLDAANFKARKLVTVGTAVWRGYGFWLIIAYKPGKSLAFQRRGSMRAQLVR